MELLCTVYPVEDLEVAARLYLGIGFRDIARPDSDTLLLSTPGSSYVDVMLERHPVESEAGAGPVFRVRDVVEFHDQHPELDWMFSPVSISPGMYALFRDSAKNPVRLVDFRSDSGRYARLFRAGQEEDPTLDVP